MTIGERIKQRRIELNMSQEELAKKTGYKSRSSIQKIENSRTLPLKKVNLMASALDCEPSYLMGWKEEESKPIYVDISEKEKMIIKAYRTNDHFRDMVDRLVMYGTMIEERIKDNANR